MGSWLCRGALALLIGLSVVAGSIAPRLSAPSALALDAALDACDWATFEARLAAVQADGGGVIVLDCDGPIVFGATQTITTDVTLIGNGATVLDGAGERRLFEVEEVGRLALIDLIVIDGFSDNGGGAILNRGALEIRTSTFSDNHADQGAGILNESTGALTIIDSTFSSNTATTEGGAIHNAGRMGIYDSTFNDNHADAAPDGLGGAIYSATSALPTPPSIRRSTFSDNGAARGGAITLGSGTMQVVSSSFTTNSAGLGGAIDALSDSVLQVHASSFDVNRASELGGAIHASFQSTLTVFGSEFNDNESVSDGGAIACYGSTCDVRASSFDGNKGEDGGAIYNSINGPLIIEDSYFHDNRATSDGGAAYTFEALSSRGSTFDNNSSANNGGALLVGEAMIIERSTFYANRAEMGGAIYHHSRNSTIYDSTFSGNHATSLASAILSRDHVLSLAGTIIVDGSGSDHCYVVGQASVVTPRPNLVDDDSCRFDGNEQADANLAALADNGGPTPTMMPIAPSDAIDAGICVLPFAFDQRGAPRPETDCDFGAVEVEAIPRIKRHLMAQAGLITEGMPIELAITAFGRDNDDLVLRYDCDAIGGPDTEIPCVFPEEGVYDIGVLVCAGEVENDCAGSGIEITVHNALPELAVTAGPVAQGQPVTITANATDPGGANDPLTYSFDCDDDGSFELTGASNQVACPLDPAQATNPILVLVADDDGGVAFESIVVNQSAAVCASRMTGALTAAPASRACPPSSVALSLPSISPVMLCIKPYTGAISWSPRGTCGSGSRMHIVPGDGPLPYCQSLFTRALRYPTTGECQAHETPGVIPGNETPTGGGRG